MNDLKIIKQYPVGTPFSYRHDKEYPVVFGWVVGYAKNPADELVFQVRWAHRPGDQLFHPRKITPVDFIHE